jgi:putative MATE family efflux protein
VDKGTNLCPIIRRLEKAFSKEQSPKKKVKKDMPLPDLKEQKGLDLTEGPITQTIFRLAWPVIISMLVETARGMANMFWVGKLGAVDLAAVVSATFLVWFIYVLSDVISVGTVALVARYVGAKEEVKASYVARQAYLFAIISSLFLAILMILVGGKYAFDLMGTEPEVTRLGLNFLRIVFAGTTFLFLIETFGACFRGSGDTKTPMKVLLTSLSLNIALDPLLIFGIGPFPRMGTSGAALATFISQGTAAVIYGFLITRGRLRFKFSLLPRFNSEGSRFAGFDFSVVQKILKIGLPLSASGILFIVVYIFLNKITATFGTEAIAALGIGNRMESISFLTCFGFSQAASALVGQNLGAKKPERAEKCAWRTVHIVVLITGFVSVMFLVFPKWIASFFISDPKVVGIAIDYLRILALSQVFMALEIVLEGSFSGAGNTIPPMTVSIPGSIARIPLAYLIAIFWGVGVDGVWWAITLTSIAKGTTLAFWFNQGKWKTKKV